MLNCWYTQTLTDKSSCVIARLPWCEGKRRSDEHPFKLTTASRSLFSLIRCRLSSVCAPVLAFGKQIDSIFIPPAFVTFRVPGLGETASFDPSSLDTRRKTRPIPNSFQRNTHTHRYCSQSKVRGLQVSIERRNILPCILLNSSLFVQDQKRTRGKEWVLLHLSFHSTKMNSKSDPLGDSVKLDLVITDESDPSDDLSCDETTAREVLCLRILSHKTRFRFGGLEISVKSPAFEVGKTFNVALDEENRLVGIESFSDPFQGSRSDDASPLNSRSPTPCGSRPSSRRVSLVSSLGLKPARIVVNPSNETEENEGLPLLAARMVLEEERPRDSSQDRGTRERSKKKKKKRGSESSSSGRDHQQPPSSSPRSDVPHYATPASRLSPMSSPFRRMASPGIIRRLMGDGDSSDQSSSDTPKLVSVGVGTSSSPRESLWFDMEGSLRRCHSCRK